ncbi:hypothetical protein [Pseudomonas sp. QTF5]|uniref:hypothetical protein n=1 Tax=Pseudomonas sp. QTF5 TaxID=1435425 RepID=UPI0004BE3B1B|nr:hypothetical protein [Pseudomonas sp. QTF5]
MQLLAPQSGLVAITIEEAATTEFPGGEQVEVGEQLNDIAEYYGSTEQESAPRICYMQLKHSTLQVDEVWQPSLGKTIRGFAERYSVSWGHRFQTIQSMPSNMPPNVAIHWK